MSKGQDIRKKLGGIGGVGGLGAGSTQPTQNVFDLSAKPKLDPKDKPAIKPEKGQNLSKAAGNVKGGSGGSAGRPKV